MQTLMMSSVHCKTAYMYIHCLSAYSSVRQSGHTDLHTDLQTHREMGLASGNPARRMRMEFEGIEGQEGALAVKCQREGKGREG